MQPNNVSPITSNPTTDALRSDLHNVFEAFTATLDRIAADHEIQLAQLRADLNALKVSTDPTLYTAAQVETVLGITAPTRRELTQRGDLPVIHFDSRPRYRKRDVEALVDHYARIGAA